MAGNRMIRTDTVRELNAYQIVEGALPEPGEGQVRLRIKACGVGYVDSLHAKGQYQMAATVPFVPGVEVAGIVDSLGQGVSNVPVGARVMCLVSVQGGFAEFALAPADQLAELPPEIDFAAAASMRVNTLTAVHALLDRGALANGEAVLVFGAAGGVGSAAVTVARMYGARVIAAGSTLEKRDYARSLGAHAVIDTEPLGWRDRLKELCGGGGPDIVFDPVCGPLFEQAHRSLNWNGRHLVVGFVGGPIPSLKVNLPLLKGAALVGVDVRNFGRFEPARAESNRALLRQWIADGTIKPPKVHPFAFEDFRSALEHAASGHGMGKTVLLVD